MTEQAMISREALFTVTIHAAGLEKWLCLLIRYTGHEALTQYKFAQLPQELLCTFLL